MHYLGYALIRNVKQSVESQVEEVMRSHIEEYNEETETHKGIWDWYQVGGRWTGYFDDYKPAKDPRNIEFCDLCNGTGLRNDSIGLEAREKDPEYTCDACHGKGKRPKWPTQWALHEGDVITLDSLEIADKYVPYTFFIDSYKVIDKKDSWNEFDFPGWSYEKEGQEKLDCEKKCDEIVDRLQKEHNQLFWQEIDKLRNKGYYLVIIDYHS